MIELYAVYVSYDGIGYSYAVAASGPENAIEVLIKALKPFRRVSTKKEHGFDQHTIERYKHDLKQLKKDPFECRGKDDWPFASVRKLGPSIQFSGGQQWVHPEAAHWGSVSMKDNLLIKPT